MMAEQKAGLRVSREAILEFIVFHAFLFAYALTFPHKDSWGPTLFLLAFVAVLLVLEYLRTHTFVSPLFFWYAFWLTVICIGRMDLNLYPFYQTWSRSLLIAVMACTVCFFWLYGLGETLRSPLNAWYQKDYLTNCNGDLLAWGVIAALVCAIGAFILNVISTGVIPQLTGDANSYRSSFVVTRYYRIVHLLRFTFALVPVAVRCAKSRGVKLLVLVLAAGLLLCEMLSGWRAYTMQAMIFAATSLFMTVDLKLGRNRRKNLRMLLGFILAGCVFIGVIAVTRDGVGGALRTKINYFVYMLYMYAAPNFLNLQSAMANVEPLGYPLYTTEAVWSLFVSSGNVAAFADIDQSIGAFNVSTYLLQPWADMGWTGMLVWSGTIGFVAGNVFSACRRNRTLTNLTLLGIMNIVVFMMHNNFFLRASSTLAWIILSVAGSRIVYYRGYRMTFAGPERFTGSSLYERSE